MLTGTPHKICVLQVHVSTTLFAGRRRRHRSARNDVQQPGIAALPKSRLAACGKQQLCDVLTAIRSPQMEMEYGIPRPVMLGSRLSLCSCVSAGELGTR